MPKGIGTFLIAQWLPQFHRAIPSAALDESLFSFAHSIPDNAELVKEKKRTAFTFVYPETFSKSDAGCLQMGQMKFFGSSSPSYSYPQTRQRQIVFPLAAFAEGWGFGLI